VPGSVNVRPATSTSRDGAQRTWTVSYRPSQTGTHQVTVNANNVWQLGGRQATRTHTVENVAPYVPTPTVTPSSTTITRTSASPSTVRRGNRSTITVRTSRDVQYVWAMVDGRRVNARRGQLSAAHANWTVDVRPDRTQSITVYANTSNSATGAATDTVRITVSGDAYARISSVTPTSINLTRLGAGSANTITVRTNAETNYVWAMVNDSRVQGTRVSTGDGEREWEIVVHPQWNQPIRVYAHTRNSNSDGNAVTRNVNVTSY